MTTAKARTKGPGSQYYAPRLLASGLLWAEGPVWDATAMRLIFSEVRGNRIMSWSRGSKPVPLIDPSNHSNGNAIDSKKRLISCETITRRLVRREIGGRGESIASRFEGKRLNSPNDVAIHPDGTIIFTDPHYGYLGGYPMDGMRELDMDGVFSIGQDGQVRLLLSDLVMPNGLAFSPNGELLYVADSGASHFPMNSGHIRRFWWNEGKILTEVGKPIAVSPGYPDGIACDASGCIWSSAGDGVHCFDPEGSVVRIIPFGEVVTNLCVGGETGASLFVTTPTSLYEIAMRG